MRTATLWIAMPLFILVVAGTGLAEAAPKHPSGTGHHAARHKFVVAFEDTKLEDMAPIRQYLIDANMVGGILDDFGKEIRLPQDIPITFKDCGAFDASWDPATKSITYCYELIKFYARGFDEVDDDTDSDVEAALKGTDKEAVVAATTLFVLLHELGHGLIDMFDLPITGREEDAADQFATIAFLGSDDDDPNSPASYFPLIAADFFRRLDLGMSEVTRDLLADEHSFGQQRYYNIMCLVLGSDPDKFEPIIIPGVTQINKEYDKDPDALDPQEIIERLQETDSMNLIPFQRAARCDSEYARYSASWERILQPLEK